MTGDVTDFGIAACPEKGLWPKFALCYPNSWDPPHPAVGGVMGHPPPHTYRHLYYIYSSSTQKNVLGLAPNYGSVPVLESCLLSSLLLLST